jgi:hypothetical protein
LKEELAREDVTRIVHTITQLRDVHGSLAHDLAVKLLVYLCTHLSSSIAVSLFVNDSTTNEALRTKPWLPVRPNKNINAPTMAAPDVFLPELFQLVGQVAPILDVGSDVGQVDAKGLANLAKVIGLPSSPPVSLVLEHYTHYITSESVLGVFSSDTNNTLHTIYLFLQHAKIAEIDLKSLLFVTNDTPPQLMEAKRFFNPRTAVVPVRFDTRPYL